MPNDCTLPKKHFCHTFLSGRVRPIFGKFEFRYKQHLSMGRKKPLLIKKACIWCITSTTGNPAYFVPREEILVYPIFGRFWTAIMPSFIMRINMPIIKKINDLRWMSNQIFQIKSLNAKNAFISNPRARSLAKGFL